MSRNACVSSLRPVLGVCLLVSLVSAPSLADVARGTLGVSMTVLPSCEFHAGGQPASTQQLTHPQVNEAAYTVACPAAYPVRASYAPAAKPLAGDAGMVFVGSRRLALEQLSMQPGPAGGVSVLTISY